MNRGSQFVSENSRILVALSNGQFRVTLHARHRMAERMISDSDIMECGRTAYRVSAQMAGKFKVEGMDLDGAELSVVCIWDGETVIITVF
jgi:hypothetical protein